jgi:hypothetical protein
MQSHVKKRTQTAPDGGANGGAGAAPEDAAGATAQDGPEPGPAGYQPAPIDTSAVCLTDEITTLTEMLAKNTHEVWARQRMADGWRYGPRRDDARKEHPGLVPYEHLTDGEKEYDRNTALETLRVILALGYRLESSEKNGAAGG